MNNYDYELLRNDLYNYCLGAFFVGKIGPASIMTDDVLRASNSELEKIATYLEFDLEKYIIKRR